MIFRKIQLNEHQVIIEKYKSGLTTYDIAKQYKVSNVTIARILKIYNIKIIGTQIYDYNDNIFTIIKNKYLEGYSVKILSKENNIPRHIILKSLKLNNIDIRSNSEECRQYKINEDYFNIIDSCDKAYFLGLLFADGCNSHNGITIGLSEGDEYILYKFIQYLYPDNDRPLYCSLLSLKNKNHKNSYKLVIQNINIKNKLEEYGLVPRKSLILKYPDKLPDEYFKDFLRGYFDGDGCIRIKKGKKDYYLFKLNFCLIGTNDFLQIMKEKMIKIFGLQFNVKIYDIKDKSVKMLMVCSIADIFKIFNRMYTNSDLYLYRKYQKFEKVFKMRGMI